ncbi:MAG: glycosyl hydrolase, partial [Bacteroidota bacterium]
MVLQKRIFLLLLSFFFMHFVEAQPTAAADRIKGNEQRNALLSKSLVKEVDFRSVGPSVFSGRVVDLAVHPDDPSHFYVAYASGGVWKTTNNGITFTPIFDQEMVMSVGDIAVDWTNGIIWVGTGENNSSRSSYSGIGMYKSNDDGKTWQHMGLDESHHIGRIVLHPTDPNTLWVAVLGHLYSANPERGVYKTNDGGKTWNQTLFVNENAGGVDMVISPNDPNVLYAATWERTRRAWNFVESGPGSGIHKSSDGGDSWTLLTTEKSGFPTGEGVGRIGLDIGMDDGEPVLYAVLDNYFRRPAKDSKDKNALSKNDLREMDKASFLRTEEKQVKAYLSANNFPKKYSYDKVKSMIEKDEIKPSALVEFTEDANSLLFDTPVIGAEVYRSTDGGKKWKKQNEDYLDQVFNSYGYYFGQIRVSPQDVNRIYILGVPVLRSDDGGKNWLSINGANVHADHHALWVNPKREGHL